MVIERIPAKTKFLVALCVVYLSFVFVELPYKYTVLFGVVHLTQWKAFVATLLFAAFFVPILWFYLTRRPSLQKLSRMLLGILLVNTLLNLLGVVFFAPELLSFIQEQHSGLGEFEVIARFLVGLFVLGFLYKNAE